MNRKYPNEFEIKRDTSTGGSLQGGGTISSEVLFSGYGSLQDGNLIDESTSTKYDWAMYFDAGDEFLSLIEGDYIETYDVMGNFIKGNVKNPSFNDMGAIVYFNEFKDK